MNLHRRKKEVGLGKYYSRQGLDGAGVWGNTTQKGWEFAKGNNLCPQPPGTHFILAPILSPLLSNFLTPSLSH